ncbi:hypothetical protein SAMN06295933_3037 [Desulfovibrio gilichinskyi]|uniref:DUF2304 domain-containing protein n=2 Tax=Desulfovibrio gilichinskyi TaxID=1519643 RepID=A0A1X7EJ72_9BACT|nr:hypothetical protein SAMN06295933_3037 [Desulfovibrio gilichinskyi]
MTLFDLVAPAISFLSVVIILVLIRRQRLGIFHSLWWLFAVFSMLFIGFFPTVVDRIGWFLGVHYPPVLPILLALCFLFVKVLTMDIERTQQEIKIRIIAQKMAAYEAELYSLKAEQSVEKAEIKIHEN